MKAGKGDCNPPVPERYSRQVLFKGIGNEGQARLMASRVAIIGCGALGAMQASLLVRAGVGTLRIIDRDFVEESNLQRQVLFDEADVRSLCPKAIAAASKLKAVNSLVAVEGIVEDVNSSNIARLLDTFDLVLDAADNFDARFLLNDYAVRNGIPWIYGGCVGSYGLTFPIVPGDTACLRCVFESAPPAGSGPSCDTAGIIGSIAGYIASLQATEALKILCGRMDRLNRCIRYTDLWENLHHESPLPGPAAECSCCGRREFPYLEGKVGADATTLCGRGSVQIRRREGTRIDLEALERRLAAVGAVRRNAFLLRAGIDKYQMTVFADGRAIISGTEDEAVAKSVYARYVGS